MIQRETNTSRPRLTHNSNSNSIGHNNNHFLLSQRSLCNRHSTVTSSILRCASQEVTMRPRNNTVLFSTTDDTTCVYPKGVALPLVEQATTVVKGASKLRASSRRDTMERYKTSRISQTYGKRRAVFGPAVKAEAGLVTSTLSLYLRCRILQPIREEEGRKRRRSDGALALELKSSKKICLRAETASQVHRNGMKRKRDTTTTAIAEHGEALEHKSKRARIRADDSRVQPEVVEVSRFIDCSLFLISLLCPFSSSQSDISYCPIHLLPSCLAGSLYCRD